jgi:small-conductance mechanosensitive channel
VGSLYSRTESNWDPEIKKNASRLAITRLLLIVCGFLLAVAASGLPMDKITIVLGALGVGIGLGLQTIVNNLVSGVILIFEQPFRIGDYIELGDKRGRVLDIGIRSSKIMMEEGAEIIMPNADLLSGRVINWTMRNEHARIEFILALQSGYNFNELETLIGTEIRGYEHVIDKMPPEILLAGITEKNITIRILVWIDDVHLTQSLKSKMLHRLSVFLDKHEIKIV